MEIIAVESLATFVIAIIVAVLCAFLPDWPGKYDPKTRQKAANFRAAAEASVSHDWSEETV